MKKEECEKRAREAARRIQEMDRIDGFRDRNLRTIYLALESGLLSPETGTQVAGAVFDALVMLRDRWGTDIEDIVARAQKLGRG